MSQTNEPSSGSTLGVVKSLRPRQHIKNTLVFAGLVFGGRLCDTGAVLRALGLFAALTLVAGGLYLINDVTDQPHDSAHPRLKLRPVAAGRLGKRTALLWGATLSVGGVLAALLIGLSAGIVVAAYASISLLYSLWLKNVPLVDMAAVASGYVLRAAAGAAVIPVAISPWLLTCTGLLALFIVFGKRRAQLIEGSMRPVFRFYAPRLLDGAMLVTASTTIAAYSAYTVHPGTVARFATWRLALTVPLVVAGLVRYIHLVKHGGMGAAPAELAGSDWFLLLDVVVWAAAVYLIIYL